jgi:HNH endonuclease
MRPVSKGTSPVPGDFADYEDAKPYLLARLGHFCSYCERRITRNLAVEHIQPKGLLQYAALERQWHNFLLGCVNCNSTKADKDVTLARYYLPDRDNTFAAFDYLPDGTVQPKQGDQIGQDTLALTGLDKSIRQTFDENGKHVAMDRVGDRMEVWGIALETKADLDAGKVTHESVVKNAASSGFFSVWMKVFEGDVVTRQLLIDGFNGAHGYRGFAGTAKDCFDAHTQPVSPRPADGLSVNGLPGGGKI